MSTIYWPSIVRPAAMDYGMEWDVQTFVARSGRIHTRALPGCRWTASITIRTRKDGAERRAAEALVSSLRGGANTLIAPHFGKPVPLGALRGAPVLDGAVAPGQNEIALTNCNGGLLAGDIIGVAGQLFEVAETVEPVSGSMLVKVNGPARVASSTGMAVVWNRPTTSWIARSNVSGPFPYLPGGLRPSFSIELVESF